MNAKHITDLDIRNFRGFDELSLHGLQAVNLIVGQNNAGKTSLLEAIAIAAAPPLFKTLPGLFRANIGNVDKRFYRWLLKDGDQSKTGRLLARGDRFQSRLAFFRDSPNQPDSHSQQLYKSPNLVVYQPKEGNSLHVRAVSVQHRGPNELVKSFGDAVRPRAGEELVHEILRAVDPRITRVRVDPVEEGNIISVDLGLSESIPLSQAGQGIYRLVAILSDLIGERPDICMIDELENGIHYSVLPQVWRGLAEISERMGVQIFATTHSQECLQAAYRVFLEEDTEGRRDFAVIQLMRVKDQIKGRVLDEPHVEAAIENEIELR